MEPLDSEYCTSDDDIDFNGEDDVFESVYRHMITMSPKHRKCYTILTNNGVHDLFSLTHEQFVKSPDNYLKCLIDIENIMHKTNDYKKVLSRIMNEQFMCSIFGSPPLHWLLYSVGQKKGQSSYGSINKLIHKNEKCSYSNLEISEDTGILLFNYMVDCGADLKCKDTSGKTLEDLLKIHEYVNSDSYNPEFITYESEYNRNILLRRNNDKFIQTIKEYL